MADENEYAAMISRLDAKRAALDTAIAALRQLAGGELGSDGAGLPFTTEGGGLRSDFFHGLSMPEAVKKYLRYKKAPQQPKDISSALLAGGFKSKAKNLYANVYTALLRLQEAGEAEKVGDAGDW